VAHSERNFDTSKPISLFFLTLFFFSVEAQANTSFANCDKISSDKKLYMENISNEAHIKNLERLVADMESLNTESKINKHKFPKSFLTKCYQSKEQIFGQYAATQKNKLLSYASYNRLIGRMALLSQRADHAIEAYTRAYEIDPTDLESLKAVFKQWLEMKSEELSKAKKSNFTDIELDRINAEGIAILKKFIDSDRIPPGAKAELLKYRSELVANTLLSESTALFDHERRLKINPNDIQALTSVAAYHFSRKNWQEAHKHFDVLAQKIPENIEVQKMNLELKMRFEETAKVLSLSQNLIKKFPKEAYFYSALGWAFEKFENLEESSKANLRALKLDSEQELARLTQSQVLEKQGDKHSSDNLIAAAIASYKKSFQFNSKNISVRKKAASLIFETHRQKQFQPPSASQKDMNYVLDLLEPIFSKENLEKKHLEIYIQSAEKSTLPKKAGNACLFHQDNYSLFSDGELILICIRALKSINRKDAAQKIAETAAKDPRFQNYQTKISQALLH
jgi:tetratricopeptide (TPR) repeat protein